MKYTIELTDNQKKQMDFMLDMANKHMGFNRKLEMTETTNVEDTNEYDRGYTQAIADYRKFERFFNSEGIEVFEDIRNTDGTISIDMILQYLSMSEIMARIKAYEEKKKAEEESIKVGDEVITSNNYKVIITFINDKYVTGIFDDGSSGEFNNETFRKTGRHFDEVEKLLDKLRGENN